MANKEDKCAGCPQRKGCRLVYEKLGKSNGPNVTWPVILAFLVPIAVFIGALVGVNALLEGRLTGKWLMAVTFSAALILSLVTVFIIWTVRNIFKQ